MYEVEDIETTTCPACETQQQSPNARLGTLGRLTHYRCCGCGMQWSERDGDPVQQEDAS